MRALSSTLLAGCGVVAAFGLAVPAAAQDFPGYGYGYGSGPNPRAVIQQCIRAVQTRIGYGGGRVLGVQQVDPGPYGGITVRGEAASGGYQYGERGPELSWRCSADARGFVRQVNVYRAQSGYGYDNQGPRYDDDFSEYGYHRY